MAAIRQRQCGTRDGNAGDAPDLGERQHRPIGEGDREQPVYGGAVDRDVIDTHRAKRRRKLEQGRGRASGVWHGHHRIRVVRPGGLEARPKKAERSGNPPIPTSGRVTLPAALPVAAWY